MTVDDVRRALALPRPGRTAQVRMSPRPRPGDIYPLPPGTKLKEAGVLILLFPGQDDLHFFLTKRTDTVETHKGQISLPGGSQEDDETLAQTALRETSEELGIEIECIQVLGEPLSSVYIPISGFRVTPFVAFTPVRPTLVAQPGEVLEIIEMPLKVLTDEKAIGEETWDFRGIKMIVPFFAINGHQVWGATGMILGEFSAMLQQVEGSIEVDTRGIDGIS
ncbi:MAG: CoA pyrophosphatase [Chloroflexi bacterium]|nr:CoA pyrophosphatase [Chloroflexota bacterium]